MENLTIENIYAANERFHENLKAAVKNVTDEQAAVVPEGEKWSLAALVEHIGIVNGGMLQICQKLLSQTDANGETTDGTFKLSDNFRQKSAQIVGVKLEAPERMVPTGKLSIAESLAKMAANRAELEKLRPLFNRAESGQKTFPHPFLGELSAHEWLLLIGRHEERHIPQVKKFIEKVAV